VPLVNKVNIDFTNKAAGSSFFAFQMVGVINPIYETTPMVISFSFLGSAGNSLASSEDFSVATNFSALSLQSTPSLLYSSDIIYTAAKLRLNFTPLNKIISGSKIKVKLPALYTHDSVVTHIPINTSAIFCTAIAGISGT